ncbi:hypothetical protein GCM10009792_25470 [Microcella alkalica]|uniref:Uncharacterized protein n=1 Tax=Microcella alkalica TaxID=355930 RepID=A0A839EEE8_9MICO|nr:hypothetical protein [Microcella alkalica]MBA8847685.1 hypothetical protein [Microcella alkalica]
MIDGAARGPALRALALTGILAVSAAGTVALTMPGEPSLAVFDRPATEVEREKEEQLAADGIFSATQNDIDVRLLLEAPSRTRETGQRIWAYRSAGSEASFFGDDDVVCLSVESTPGTVGTVQGCMLIDDVARRGFVPLSAPRPFLFVDGDEFIIEWGPTGDARLIDRPTPPSSEPTP